MDNNLMELAVFEEWLKARDIRDSTIYIYVSATKKFLLGKPDVNDINSYNDFIFEHSIKKRSYYYYDALKLYIKFKFVKEPNKAHNIIRALIKPKVEDPKKHVKYLDDEERERVIGLIKNYKHRIIARIQNMTGVRAGDIFRLTRGSISYEPYDDDTIVLRIDFLGKGGKRFVKWIFDPTVQAHIDLFLKSNYLNTEYYFIETEFCSVDSTEHTIFSTNYHKYWTDLKQALKTAGIEYKQWATHDFRRSMARKVWDKTKDAVILKEILNHQDFNTTLRYLRGTGLQVRDVYYDLNKDKLKKL